MTPFRPGRRARLVFLTGVAALSFLTTPGAARQTSPLTDLKTTAESSGFTSTSTYGSVTSFLAAVAAAAPTMIDLTTMGSTAEGRAMPLVVVGAGLADGSPQAVRTSGKLRVWIQAGTHGNEVDGKEATLILLRDLAGGRHGEWLQSMVLLVNPLYNADGNERVSVERASAQNGPIGGVGQLGNAQGQDLDRDYIALRSPESNAFVKAWSEYDPQISIDLHTSDVACSAYLITYAAPLNPNTSETLIGPLKNDWFPFISRNLKSKRAMDSFYRGRVEEGENGCGTIAPPEPLSVPPAKGRKGAATPASAIAGRGRAGRGPAVAAPTLPAATPPVVTPVADNRAWTALESRPSLGANYIGLRNRFALVGETYAHAPFEDRIKAAGYFVEEALNFVYGAAPRLKKAIDSTDPELIVGRRQATTARVVSGAKIEILMGEVDITPNATGGAPIRRRKDVVKPVQMIDRLWFEPATDAAAAAEYYVPASLTGVVDLLKKHGVQMRQLTAPTKGVEQFNIAANSPRAAGATGALAGDWQTNPSVTVPTGTWVVRMNQPLARLAFYLLEPTSDDGLVSASLVDEALKGATTYPISRKR